MRLAASRLQGDYAVGMVFLPQDPAQYEAAKAAVHKVAANQGHSVLGWRRVPTDNRCAPAACSRPLSEPQLATVQPQSLARLHRLLPSAAMAAR